MGLSKEPYGYIYKTTNLMNGKVYIGQSINFKKLKSYLGGGLVIKHAVKKYGRNKFKKDILGFCYFKEDLDEAEKECIDFFNSRNRYYGYNIREGGHRGKNAQSTKRKISERNKGRKTTEEFKIKCRERQIGKKHTEETKKKNK